MTAVQRSEKDDSCAAVFSPAGRLHQTEEVENENIDHKRFPQETWGHGADDPEAEREASGRGGGICLLRE